MDFHCHVYPDAIAEKAAAAVAGFYRVERGKDVPNQSGTLAHVLAAQQEAGITKTLLCSAATAPSQVRSINKFLASCAAASGGRCLAFGTLHPDSEDLEGDIAHLKALGLRGVKLHPDMQRFALNEDRTMALFEAAGDSLMFLLHTGDDRYAASNPEQLQPVLKAFPGTTFIGAHMAGYTIWERAAQALAGRYDNLYVDISSTMFALSDTRCVELVRAYGADRVLFGTDFPMWNPKSEAEHFFRLPLTEEERQAIAWNNGAKLLGL